MTILIIITCAPVHAADFDILLSRFIKSAGIYNGSEGLIYAAASHNGSYLLTVYADSGAITFRAYGSENEPADTIVFNIGGKNKYRFEMTNTDNDFCISVYTNEKGEYFRLINDTFTKTEKKPGSAVPIASYSSGTTKILAEPYDTYNTLNDLKYLKIKSYALPRRTLAGAEESELLKLIKSSADLMEYDSDNYDIHTVMRHTLFTYRNFTLLSDIPPDRTDVGSIMLCSSDFIDDVLYKAFRLEADKPAVNMLTELGYCYNNGSYYSVGGYDTYFATDVKEITDVFTLPDGSLLVIFSDTYTEGNSQPIPEISSAVAAKDDDGFYLLKLSMGSDLPDRSSFIAEDDRTQPDSDKSVYLPLIIAVICLSIIGIIIYRFIIV